MVLYQKGDCNAEMWRRLRQLTFACRFHSRCHVHRVPEAFNKETTGVLEVQLKISVLGTVITMAFMEEIKLLTDNSAAFSGQPHRLRRVLMKFDTNTIANFQRHVRGVPGISGRSDFWGYFRTLFRMRISFVSSSRFAPIWFQSTEKKWRKIRKSSLMGISGFKLVKNGNQGIGKSGRNGSVTSMATRAALYVNVRVRTAGSAVTGKLPNELQYWKNSIFQIASGILNFFSNTTKTIINNKPSNWATK